MEPPTPIQKIQNTGSNAVFNRLQNDSKRRNHTAKAMKDYKEKKETKYLDKRKIPDHRANELSMRLYADAKSRQEAQERIKEQKILEESYAIEETTMMNASRMSVSNQQEQEIVQRLNGVAREKQRRLDQLRWEIETEKDLEAKQQANSRHNKSSDPVVFQRLIQPRRQLIEEEEPHQSPKRKFSVEEAQLLGNRLSVQAKRKSTDFTSPQPKRSTKIKQKPKPNRSQTPTIRMLRRFEDPAFQFSATRTKTAVKSSANLLKNLLNMPDPIYDESDNVVPLSVKQESPPKKFDFDIEEEQNILDYMELPMPTDIAKDTLTTDITASYIISEESEQPVREPIKLRHLENKTESTLKRNRSPPSITTKTVKQTGVSISSAIMQQQTSLPSPAIRSQEPQRKVKQVRKLPRKQQKQKPNLNSDGPFRSSALNSLLFGPSNFTNKNYITEYKFIDEDLNSP